MLQEPREKYIEVKINEDLINYLEFLERTRYIKNMKYGLHKALVFFRKLSMHEWLPDIYRIGGSRVIIIDRGMFIDLFNSMSKYEVYRLGSTSALKRKVLEPRFRDINLTYKKNWPIVLNEMQNYGWGNFKIVENEIKIENVAVPEPYIRGYIESLFNITLIKHELKIDDLILYKISKSKIELWL